MDTADRLDKIGELLIEGEGPMLPEPAQEQEQEQEAQPEQEPEHHQETELHEAVLEDGTPVIAESMTFPEAFVDTILESAGNSDAKEIVSEMLLWVKMTDDQGMLQDGLSLVSELADGLAGVLREIRAKLPNQE